MKRLACVALLALVFAGAPSAAHADARSDAAALFREAQSAFDRKAYRAAALGFEEANRRAPTAAAMYNAAIAWRAEGSPERAADAFAAALADPALVDPERADAAKNLAELERNVGIADVTAPAGSTISVAHVVRAPSPRRVHLKPGEHVVTIALASGATTTRTVQLRAGAVERVVVEPPPLDPPAEPKPVEIAPPPAPPPAASPKTDEGNASTVLAFGSFGLSAVAVGASIFFGVRTLDARDAYEASAYTDAGLRDDAVSNRTFTNVSIVAAGAFAIAGIVFLVTRGDGAKATAIR